MNNQMDMETHIVLELSKLRDRLDKIEKMLQPIASECAYSQEKVEYNGQMISRDVLAACGIDR